MFSKFPSCILPLSWHNEPPLTSYMRYLCFYLVCLSPCLVHTFPSRISLEQPFLPCHSSIFLNNFLQKDSPRSIKDPPQGSPGYPQGSTWLLGEGAHPPSLFAASEHQSMIMREVIGLPFLIYQCLSHLAV